MRIGRLLVFAALLLLLLPREAHAYIGPGAGFALVRRKLDVSATVRVIGQLGPTNVSGYPPPPPY